MLPMPKKAAGLVFNDDGECIAMYSHSGEKDQFNKKDAAGLVFNDNGECIAMYSHSGEIDQLNNLDFLELMPAFSVHNMPNALRVHDNDYKFNVVASGLTVVFHCQLCNFEL